MVSGVCAREGTVGSGEGAGDVGYGGGWKKRTKGRRGEENVAGHGPANRRQYGMVRGWGEGVVGETGAERWGRVKNNRG